MIYLVYKYVLVVYVLVIFLHQLLHINSTRLKEILLLDEKNLEIIRPGIIRINFNYFINQQEIDYILYSIQFVCKYAELFLPYYILNQDNAEFRYFSLKNNLNKTQKWLSGDFFFFE